MRTLDPLWDPDQHSGRPSYTLVLGPNLSLRTLDLGDGTSTKIEDEKLGGSTTPTPS